jgi:hypothetical protein
MTDPVIRPQNSVLLFKLQAAEGTPAVPSAAADAVPFEADSLSYSGPFKNDPSNEVGASLVKAAPLVVGQPVTLRFRSRIKGAGAGVTYTSGIKPPYHQLFAACGMPGFFTAAIATAVLTAGTAISGTLGTGYAGTAQLYTGMPLIITAGAGVGHTPLITDYTAGKVATLSDTFSPVLDVTTSVSLPANWTYAGSSPRDAATRAAQHPAGTAYLYEDGVLHQFVDCRGICDLDGDTARPGFGSFQFTGIYVGTGSDVAVPTGVVLANHSGPMLVQGAGTPPAMLVNRKGLPISKWSSTVGGQIESPEDPNTQQGFAAGQITAREPMFGADPLATLIATRNTLAEIAAFSQYPIALRFGGTAGNRWSLLHPVAQPVDLQPGTRGSYRSHQNNYRALSNGRDAQDRDLDRIICFY